MFNFIGYDPVSGKLIDQGYAGGHLGDFGDMPEISIRPNYGEPHSAPAKPVSNPLLESALDAIREVKQYWDSPTCPNDGPVHYTPRATDLRELIKSVFAGYADIHNAIDRIEMLAMQVHEHFEFLKRSGEPLSGCERSLSDICGRIADGDAR